MASVVFMRGVNVGGHKKFSPAALARDLAALDVVNVGAAGTFVVRKSVGRVALQAELSRRLPFEADVMICTARDIIDLVFPGRSPGKDVRPFVTVMAKRPGSIPRLPVLKPAGDDWQVKIVAVSGVFALSLWRRLGRSIVYPNEVVEKSLCVSATTRNWDTILKVRALLEK